LAFSHVVLFEYCGHQHTHVSFTVTTPVYWLH
jgi:hypothetical protein